tara:strand:- start:527 stop:1201 length:675 start_codon:yes stop_codon:yes gene_type:complete
MIKNIINLGDAALYCNFGEEVNKNINLKVINFFKNLKQLKIKGITNISPSYNKLIISFDLSETNFQELKEKIINIKFKDFTNEDSENIKIPICCDEEFTLDLKRLSSSLKISKEEIIKKFLDKSYYCYMTGFIAGMPFLGDIDEQIRFKRLETPRVKVPKGAIGITEQFCNIYTFESPGGWNIIGNTPEKVFDKLNDNNPALIKPGDTINFYKISKKEYLNWND